MGSNPATPTHDGRQSPSGGCRPSPYGGPGQRASTLTATTVSAGRPSEPYDGTMTQKRSPARTTASEPGFEVQPEVTPPVPQANQCPCVSCSSSPSTRR
ncbi:hypothetical protein D5H78_01170 [Vallicoccus soli]|uniref:Uncharacterized protein n=1 Tax=Vallicoccus soli TaxID=2339232 RepID=A0A3A3Z085_9ACTN|nr:hypothetical protein D5H78_01170 [Vallicoccus soli]